MYDLFSLKDFSMPEGFLWGSGYAGHQVEGNNIHSDRYEWELENQSEELGIVPSGMACNSYNMYQDDINLISSLGHKAFRSSVEWARIEPEEGVFCEEAIEHYIKFFAGLKEKGITTFVTLVHGSMPAWFGHKGTFKYVDNIKYFERYVEYIVPKIAPYADFFITLNEMNSNPDLDVRLNTVKAHAAAYHIIKKYSNAPVSISLAFFHHMPYRPHDPLDRLMTEYVDFADNEFFLHAMRTGELLYPYRDAEYLPEIKDTVDYWSINCYTRNMVDSRKANLAGKRYDYKELKLTPMDFYLEEFHPECMIANLTRLKDKPIYVTENGCSCDDDRFRIVFLSLYLSAVSEAIKMGADVRGYLEWSLLDNYEWTTYLPKFGLCEVDFETFKRTPKNSAYFYKDIIENNGFNQQILRKYLNELPSLGLK